MFSQFVPIIYTQGSIVLIFSNSLSLPSMEWTGSKILHQCQTTPANSPAVIYIHKIHNSFYYTVHKLSSDKKQSCHLRKEKCSATINEEHR